jgi:hypothetical protein
MGGLGNQLFQIFATISCAMDSNTKFFFFNMEKLGDGNACTIRPTYWNNFLARMKIFLKPILHSLPEMNIIRENGFHYTKLPINKINSENKDIILYGYFQSYKYFENNYNNIYNIIGVERLIHKLLKKMYINKSFFNNTISMHFRLGDYKNLQDYHPIAKYEYYKNSLQYIQDLNKDKPFCIMYFCENKDIDEVNYIISQLNQEYMNYTFFRADYNLQDWEQVLLMSCCENNIIANSTFSWWGAYFNTNNNKIVCYPDKWFGPKLNTQLTVDLCPPEWIKITE